MLALRSSARGCLLLAVSLIIGCDADTPLSPDPDRPLFTSANGGAAPSDLTATADAPGQIDLTWQDHSDTEAGFEIRASTDGPNGVFTVWRTTAPSVTSTSFTELGASRTYCFNVRAFTRKGKRSFYSEPSNTVCPTTLPPPPPQGPNAPSNLSVTQITGDQIVVAWVDNSDDEEWFRLERSATSSGPWTFIGTLLGSGYTSYSFAGLPSEQQLCYRVFATNATGESAPSNVDCIILPAAPTGLTATGADGVAIDLRWTDNSSVEDGYQVHRSAADAAWSVVAELPANAATYRDGTASGDKTYYYAVRTKRNGGYSYLSNIAAASADGVLRPPARPTLWEVSGYYLGTMWLVWSNNVGGVDSYKLERCDKEVCADADFTVIATFAAHVSYSQDGGLADWTIYTYRLRATNAAGDSEPSAPMQGRTCIDGVDWESPCYPPLPESPPATAALSRSPHLLSPRLFESLMNGH